PIVTITHAARRPCSRLLPAMLCTALLCTALPVCCSAMASLHVLTFDHEGPSLGPPATANSATRSEWLTRDAAARLANRNHLPLAECAHFEQHKTAKALYDALNLWPCLSLPETSPTLRWTRKVGDASVFRVWGSHAFVRDTSTDKLSAHAIPCVAWKFRDVTFDESVPFYRLFPYRSAPLPPPPLFLAPGPPPVDPLLPLGPAPSGVSQVDPLPGTVPVEVAVDSGAARGPVSGGALSGGAEPAGAEPGGAEPAGAEPRGAEPEGAEPRGTASSGGHAGALPRLSPRPEPLSPQQLREWFARCTRLRSGAAGAGDSATGGTGFAGAGATSLGGAGVLARSGGLGGAGAAGPGGARTRSTGAAGAGGAVGAGTGAGATGTGGTGAGGTRASGLGGTGAAGASGDARVGAGGTRAGAAGGMELLELVVLQALELGTPMQDALTLGPAYPLPAPSPYTEQTGGLIARPQPVSRPASPVRAVCTGHHVPCPRPPPVPGKHHMALRPSSVPQRVPLPSPPASSLADGPDPESDLVRAASTIVPRLLATIVTDPSFESAAASAQVAELFDFAAACRLDYTSSLVGDSESDCPLSLRSECAPGTDVLEVTQEDIECLAAAVPHLVSMLIAPEGDPNAPDISTPRSWAEAITGPYSSQWRTTMDAEMASWKSTGTYVDAVPPPQANIVDGMWVFRVKRSPGSPPVFKARYVARGFSRRQGVDYFHTFSPSPKMTTLRVLLHVAAQCDYELHSLDFSTAFLQSSLHEDIWMRRPPSFTGSFPTGTQWSLQWPVYGLCQVPREWHNTLRTTLTVST
ncbi:unnamed protein product, partial [Closterium sp. NIES-54]